MIFEPLELESLENKLISYENEKFPVKHAWINVCKILQINEDSGWFELGIELSHAKWFLSPSNPYHDNIHTAQVMHSGAVLLAAEIGNNPYLDKIDVQMISPLFMIALMFHDYAHTGKTNSIPFELENIAIKHLENIVLFDEDFYKLWSENIEFKLKLPLKDILRIVSSLIQTTEVTIATPVATSVYKNRVENIQSGEIFNTLDVICKIISEADLLPSVMPNLGRKNGEKLSKELNIPMIKSSMGRLSFLKTVDFSSYGSVALGIPKVISLDIEKIKNELLN